MKFKERLLQGSLVKRYKRFFVDIKYKNKIITGHCPNSGSMKGLLNMGNKIWFSESDNLNRKLKYTLEIIEVEKKMVGINTLLTNKIVLEALNCKKINSLIKFNDIKTEVKFSNNTRFDFLLLNKKEKCFLEVKNVTLVRGEKMAEFPDVNIGGQLKVGVGIFPAIGESIMKINGSAWIEGHVVMGATLMFPKPKTYFCKILYFCAQNAFSALFAVSSAKRAKINLG